MAVARENVAASSIRDTRRRRLTVLTLEIDGPLPRAGPDGRTDH
jgi:hypothetical protein